MDPKGNPCAFLDARYNEKKHSHTKKNYDQLLNGCWKDETQVRTTAKCLQDSINVSMISK